MKRTPDTVLAHGVLDRRKRFPVAAVVVVNEDISILRSSLEEVAVVVEHIVSENRCSECRRAWLFGWILGVLLQTAAETTVAARILTPDALELRFLFSTGYCQAQGTCIYCQRAGVTGCSLAMRGDFVAVASARIAPLTLIAASFPRAISRTEVSFSFAHFAYSTLLFLCGLRPSHIAPPSPSRSLSWLAQNRGTGTQKSYPLPWS